MHFRFKFWEAYLSTIESTLVVLELLVKHEVEKIDQKELNAFLNPFFRMIAYQKELIANPKSHAVRFKRHYIRVGIGIKTV